VSPFPLAINTMGSQKRMAMALGIDSIDDLARQMTLISRQNRPPAFEMREPFDTRHRPAPRPAKACERRPVQGGGLETVEWRMEKG